MRSDMVGTMSGGHAGTGSGPASRGPLERAVSPFDLAVRKYYYAAMTTAATPDGDRAHR